MRAIQMVDLKAQYEAISTEVDQAIKQVILSGAFINGPEVKAFEQELAEYVGCNYAVGCGNGTDALQIALMALDLQPGDEVITTPFTFVATAEVIELLGLKPVFVDVDPDSFNLDVDEIEAAITPKTKCIIPVHLYGQPCDMEKLMDVASKNNVYVVEDNAQAIGADYTFSDGTVKKTGSIGHIGCVSFYPSKNLGAYGDGGALTVNDEALHDRIRLIANHGSSRRYYHDAIGVNSRLDSIQAAILRIKLRKLDEYANRRRKVADYYDQAFANHPSIHTPKRTESTSHVFHQYTLKVERREELNKYLSDQGIPSMVYYPVPLHLQKAYNKDNKHREGDLSNCEHLCREVLSLPIHTEMDNKQLDYIAEQILNFYK